jgi:hypothetical protein
MTKMQFATNLPAHLMHCLNSKVIRSQSRPISVSKSVSTSTTDGASSKYSNKFRITGIILIRSEVVNHQLIVKSLIWLVAGLL